MPLLGREELRSFYERGYLIVPAAAPPELVDEARRLADGDKDEERQAVFARLFNDGNLRKAAQQLIGGDEDRNILNPISSGQNAKRAPQGPGSDRKEESGYPYNEVPWFNWTGHMDGLWSGGGPILQSRDEDTTEWYREAGTNGTPLEPRVPGDLQANILNFTCLAGIALSDQLEDGDGQVGLLGGAHHVIREVYETQAESGGPIGPGGPGWGREHTEAPNGHGLRYYPDEVRTAYAATAASTSDGRLWPRPDIIKLRAGDGVLVLHEVPHAATRCGEELGASTRYQVYFRLYRSDRPDGKEGTYPEALLDTWLEFEGMHKTVREQEGQEADRARL